nr:hemopexin repeat-containing protein [Pseudonocardia sp.]
MTDAESIPSYEGMFFEAARASAEATSVYSPAAYLADLLQLVDDHFQDASILRNRPGITRVPLDPAHTDTEVPYLDVVNDVLAQRLAEELGENAYEAMLTLPYPLTMPFSREDVRRRRVLHHAGVPAAQVYRQFAPAPDADVVARECLGLTPQDVDAVTTVLPGDRHVLAGFGLPPDANLSVLDEVEKFLERTGMAADDLRELLFQNLSQAATDPAGDTERVLATGFFVNNGQTPVSVTADGKRLTCGDAPVPWQWFERTARFVRLAGKIGMSFTDLDLVLRTCCGNVIDGAALRVTAMIRNLQDLYQLPLDVVCSLVAPMSTSGIGDADIPADLFDRTFNGPPAATDRAVLLGGPFVPAAYTGYPQLTCQGDLFDPQNADFLRRVAAGTGLTETDLGTAVARFRAGLVDGNGDGPFEGEIDTAALSLLFRIGTLTRTLGLAVPDLLGILDVLRSDPSTRTLNPSGLVADPGTVEHDPFRILASGRPTDGLWLAEILFAIAQWTKDHDFGGAELARTLGAGPETADTGGDTGQVIALDGLYQAFQSVLLTPTTFVSDRLDDRDAAVVHRTISAAGGPVSNLDARIVRDDGPAAASRAFEALARLPLITATDFRDIAIEERLRDKIFANLVFRGYLEADGTLVEPQFPIRVEDFLLTGGFAAVQAELFTVMSQLRLEDAEEQPSQDSSADPAADPADSATDSTAGDPGSDAGGPTVADGTNAVAVHSVVPDQLDPAGFYPSDLRWVEGLSPADDLELYDNLVYNRYIDADGTVLRNGFFADAGNADAFVVDADLGDAAPAVWTLIHDRVARFATDALTLDQTIFSQLPLDDPAIRRLVDDLLFNGHIDASGGYTDKVALLALGRDRLEVALEFYPLRRGILEAMQDQITAFRTGYVTFARESFEEIASAVLATLVDQRLTGTWVVDGRVPDNLAPAIVGGTADLGLGVEFAPDEQDLVLARLAAILHSVQRYRVDPAALAGLGLDQGEVGVLVGLLQSAGDLTAELMVAQERLPFFVDVHSALGFAVPGFSDYDRDVFFLLHAVAKEIAAATGEIVGALATQAGTQRSTLFAGLQDVWGVTPATATAMAVAVCGTPAATMDTLMVPVLRAGAAASRVTTVPADARFRLVYRRLARFAAIAAKLNLDAVQTEIAFRDRDLVGSFPERLVLPPGVTTVDALLPSADGTVSLFVGTNCWRYSASTYALTTTTPDPLTAVSHRFAALTGVDAAFVDATGTEWLVGRDGAGAALTFVREGLTAVWVTAERTWGAIRNTFAAPSRIDSALRDRDGKTYLFSGDQYVRYSGADYAEVDPGYPRTIAGNWEAEGLDVVLPAEFRASVDASFQGLDGVTYLFSGGSYLPAPGGADSAPVVGRWGRVRNGFVEASGVDAAYAAGGRQFLLRGDQVVSRTDGFEAGDATVDEGYPLRLETYFADLPVEFEAGVDAAFCDAAGAVHLFRNGRTVALAPGDGLVVPVNERWGLIGPVLPTGTVDAAFVGMDGKTYLFSGGRYIRYSGADYTAVDPGYPRLVDGDWGGLRTVTASFVLDEKTYLFGAVGTLFSLPVPEGGERAAFTEHLNAGQVPPVLRDTLRLHGLTPVLDKPVSGTSPEWVVRADDGMAFTVRLDPTAATVTGDRADENGFCVRYSTRDYSTPDAGHPRPTGAGNWWNLPDALLAGEPEFAQVDAVFAGTDGHTYLFAGGRFVVFDNRERWWSEPRSLADDWDSLPFDRVDAAFVGNDGRTYVFSGSRYVRFSGADYTRRDDRYPNDITTFWGAVPNTIARTGAVDAAVVLDGYTYLFSGDQYVRYDGDTYATVDNGYPKNIADSLTSEPRFVNLTVPPTGPIDAVTADRRTVALFTGGRCHVVSDSLYRLYADLFPATPGCAFVEDGAVLAEGPTGWHHLGALEAEMLVQTPVRPRSLRTAPVAFRSGLSAVLAGTDGNTYLFQGTSCYDVALGRAFPAEQDWGRPRNTVAQAGTVDAGFVGRDGLTYVFGGDQFVVYSGTSYVDVEIDGRPQPIAEHWGGLDNVAIAFVDGEQTFLCEAADDDGRFRYVVYSGTDYTRADPGSPHTADADFWDIPPQWREEGFDRLAAVVVERGNRFLLSGTRYLQYTEATNTWSYPHELSRLWPGLPFDADAGSPLQSAFTGADGAYYLFSRGRFCRHDGLQASPAEPVEGRWGRLHNNFASTTRTNLVDAAFVFQSTTYLFSGDQYVRYSGPDYRYVDTGYPRPVVALRQEDCFANLPDSVENLLADRVAAGAETVIDAVVADDRTVHLLIGPDCHSVSTSLEADYDVAGLGRVRNTLADTGRVDASFVKDDHTYLFSGDQYVRYTGDRYSVVDEGYPLSIETALPAEIGVSALPEPFGDGIDAALDGADGKIYLFAGRQFVGNGSPSPTPQPVAGHWGQVRNRFAPSPGSPGAVDAAFVSAAGHLYAFAGDQYVRYTTPGDRYADDGYPRSIKDDWGDLPVAFESGIDGAFRFEDRTYFVRGEDYLRYSDPDHRRVDRLYPQPLTARWGPWVDYRFTDLRAIARFARLHAGHPDVDGGLAGIFAGTGTVADPYQRLATVFGWDVDEIAWAVRHHAFLPAEAPAHVDIEIVSRLVDLFTLTTTIGGTPSTVHEQVWSPLYGDAAASSATSAGEALQGMLLSHHIGDDRPALVQLLHQEMNEAVRDALVAAVIANTDGVHSASDLFDLLLIDVEMGGLGTTSAVREAIGATQLFFHRYFLNLQPVTVRGGPGQPAGPDAVKAELKSWWAWMQNYQVWAANRKVYLYPENYIRPELRATKTPAFATLENDLLQGELTADAVRQAYTTYLDDYTEVSRLTIAGGYVYEAPHPSDHAWDLVLFGRTKTDPRRFYYRLAAFSREASRSAVWQPWSKVDVRIDSDRVYPVFAFDRVFVFWAGLDAAVHSTSSDTFTDRSSDTGHTYTRQTPPTYTVKIYYSFYDLNGVWTPEQQLTMTPPVEETFEVSDIQLLVETSSLMPPTPGDDVEHAHDNIVVRCGYTRTDPVTAATTRRTVAFTLTAELFTQPTTAVAFDDTGIGRFQSLFDEPVDIDPFAAVEAAMLARNDAIGGMVVRQLERVAAELPVSVPPPSVVMFNNPKESITDRWFGFDYKGGSFLCKPAPLPSVTTLGISPLPLHHPGDRLPHWNRVDAGFATPDGTAYFFDNAGHRYVTVDRSGVQGAAADITTRWGRSRTGFPASGVVDAVVAVDGHVFVFSGAEYARFSGGSFAVMDEGYPREITSNDDGLPRWPRVVAGFTGVDGRTYLFQGGSFVDLAAPGRKKPVADRWGRVEGAAAGTGIFDTGTVAAAYVIGEHTFLVSGGRYVRYTGGVYEFVDDGYPRDLAGNPDGLPSSPGVVFTQGASRYEFDNEAKTYTVAQPGEPPEQHTSTDLGGGDTIGSPAAVWAAGVLGNHLYLVGDTAFVRYTLGPDGAVPTYIDAGYPKACTVPVDALVVSGGGLVVFSGESYARIPAGQELDAAVVLVPIDGSWGNLPQQFHGGLDGAIDTPDALYLLAGRDYVRYGKVTADGSPPQLPYEQAAGQFEIIRLTTGTASTLNQQMFTGGVGAVLDVVTQETDERPSFNKNISAATVIKVRPDKVEDGYLPVTSYLDFDSANGLYYWEIFFHAPLLIAQALRAAQRFEEAMVWLGYIFDPTQNRDHWRFLPFRETDVAALVDTCLADLAALDSTDATLGPALEQLRTLAPVFAQERVVQAAEGDVLTTVPAQVAAKIAAIPVPAPGTPAAVNAWHDLQETGAVIARLDRRYQLMIGGRETALLSYLNDPFDPHAVAAARTGAYRRAVVMAYLDNLLDWGDMLFRQYTGESIDQARMLYILAHDVLGPRPHDLGMRPLREVRNAGQLTHSPGEYDFLVRQAATLPAGDPNAVRAAAVHASIATVASIDPADTDSTDSYFTIPENSRLTDYWTRVEDRLTKIRHSLDILGVSRPIPLFEPPLDPMALVKARAAGTGLGAVSASGGPVTAPHYRFTVVLAKAQELTDRLTQFGGDLLAALEKHDAEALSVLQNTQDAVILAMTTAIKEAAIGSATATITELTASQSSAQMRQAHYQSLIDTGQLPVELAQVGLMTGGVTANAVAAGLKLAAGIGHVIPQVKIGLFNFGTEEGGLQLGTALDSFADFSQMLGGTLSGVAEILGLYASHQRTTQDWQLQLDTAVNDLAQIAAQLDGAGHQLASARRDLEILQQDVVHNVAVARFMTEKFSTVALYQWMAGQLTGVYVQAYGLAYDLARQAECALQFERGLPATEATIIQPVYWEGQHGGLLAGEKLGLDLARLAVAYLDTGGRGLEITKRISLIDLDPLALLTLRSTGACEFSFTEALFDYDFPGHYRRQIRTLSVALAGAGGQGITANAMLTQLQHKTVLTADSAAAKYLLDAKGLPPSSIRSDWRPTQQIALSQVPDGQDSNGLFELRFDDDRYLPFEGTGAVSTWRLELTGRHDGYTPDQLQDAVITVKYTAQPGDPTFTSAVKGLLKPYPAYHYLDLARDFPDNWQQFQAGAGDPLTITLTPAMFPNMSSRQISAVYAHFDTTGPEVVSMTLNSNPNWVLTDGRLLVTTGLNLSAAGSEWTFELHGDKTSINTVDLVVSYTASVR